MVVSGLVCWSFHRRCCCWLDSHGVFVRGPAPDLGLLLEAGQFPASSLRNSSPTPLCPASIDDTYLHICPVLFHILSSFSGKTEATTEEADKSAESGLWIAIKEKMNFKSYLKLRAKM